MSTRPLRILILLCVLSRLSIAQCAMWDPGFGASGLDNSVLASVVYDDGSGPALYVGGWLTAAGGTSATHIAKWNGTSWSAMGNGIPDPVSSLAVFDDGTGPALYAGSTPYIGTTSTNFIWRWNGASWSMVGTGVRGAVLALTVYNDGSGPALYAAGGFMTPGEGVAKWNGTNWSAVGGLSTPVYSLAVYDDGSGPHLYAGGGFTLLGSNGTGIAKWTGTIWTGVGGGLFPVNSAVVYSLAVYDNGTGPALCVGGSFSGAGMASSNNVLKWNGTSWSALGTGVGGGFVDKVLALQVHNDGSGPALYVGGYFATAGGTSAGNIAKWNGASWSPLGGGTNNVLRSLAVYNVGASPTLFAGGDFTLAGGVSAAHLAAWNGASWASVGARANSPDGQVRAFVVWDDGSGPALYASGDFTVTGATTVNHIAKWDGTAWSALGSGIASGGSNAHVSCLAVYDDGSGPALYAGGYFGYAGGTLAGDIAKWNRSSWSAVGGGIAQTAPQAEGVAALQVYDAGSGPALYAGGLFNMAGGASVSNIAKWNGSTWSAVGGGFYGPHAGVTALQVYDDGSGPALYVGGGFTTPYNGIAKWNGTSLAPLGSGIVPVGYSAVRALATFDDASGPALYVGGTFTIAGGTSASHIARWDGASWSALGSGLDGDVYALRRFDDGTGPALFAGGSFTLAGGVSASDIARWDGANWSAVGSGMGSGPYHSVSALADFNDGHDTAPDLYVGGIFSSAGGLPSAYFAEWHGCSIVSFCFGDGSAGTCPCANNGLATHGCNNSAATGGALLSASGTESPDTLVLTQSSELPSSLSIFLQGDAQLASPAFFGDGLRCIGGVLERLYVKNAGSGTASAPGAGDPSITARSAALGDPIALGTSRYYQVYYRDPSLAFCPRPQGDTFNVGNALRVLW